MRKCSMIDATITGEYDAGCVSGLPITGGLPDLRNDDQLERWRRIQVDAREARRRMRSVTQWRALPVRGK